MTRHHVVIVGGGITGLSAAWHLANSSVSPAPKVTVVEASSRLGGKIRTTPFDGFDVDEGADAFLATQPSAVELCRELGIVDELVPPVASNAWIWSRRRLRRFPKTTVLGVPSNLRSTCRVVSLGGVVRASADLVLPKRVGRSKSDEQSVGALVRKRLGDEVADRLVDPLVGNINVGAIDKLSLDAASPQIAALRIRNAVSYEQRVRQYEKGHLNPAHFWRPIPAWNASSTH